MNELFLFLNQWLYVLSKFKNYSHINVSLLNFARWAGIAKGVGVQKILGRIHMVQLQIENDFLITSFSILEQQPMDVLLGLDMLKRHQVNT